MIYIKTLSSPAGISRADHARLQSKTAHEMLKSLIYELYGIDITEDMLGKGEHGKPYIIGHENIHFNISHCAGAAAIAFGDKPIGVDIERIREVKQSLAEFVCSKEELEFLSLSSSFATDFFRLWTLKESYIKAIGTGLSYPMKDVVFDIRGDEIRSNVKEFIFSQYILKDFALSLCYYADDEKGGEAGYRFI